MKHMISNVKAILAALLLGILAVAAAYWQRGYWAVGAEIMLPIILLIILLDEKQDKE